MATTDQVFSPTTAATAGNTVKITAPNTQASASSSISAANAGHTIRVFNNGTATVFVRMSNEASGITAAATDIPIAAGGSETFASPGGPGVAVAIAALSSTATNNDVYFTPGYGV